MRMKLPNGNFASNDTENASVFQPHFTSVFNNTQKVDENIKDKLVNHLTIYELSDPPTYAEFNSAIFKMKNNKASGVDKLAIEAIKALPPWLRINTHRFIVEFWKGKDIEQLHQNILACVPKNGDLSDPNRWRGICLVELVYKILATIMNSRLHRILKMRGSEFQAGSTPGKGCADAVFSLKTALHIRRAHGLPTWALFIDLVKSYDTVNHQLMWDILYSFGVPTTMINVLKRIRLKLTIESQDSRVY